MQFVVDMFVRMHQRSEKKNTLCQLRYELTRLRDHYYEQLERLPEASAEYESVYSMMRGEEEIILAQIGEIETADALARAYRWGVPIPYASEESPFWRWNNAYGRFFLSLEGHREIRHAIATEMDIKFRPWLSWGALIVSGVSLVVAVLKP